MTHPVLSALAACTPAGLDAVSTCAALRGGLGNLVELITHSVDGELFTKEPLTGGRVPTEWLLGEPQEEEWPGHERFGLPPPPPRSAWVPPGLGRVLELIDRAAAEVRHDGKLDAWDGDRPPVYMAIHEHDPPLEVAAHLQATFGLREDQVVVDAGGRAAALALLRRALDELEAGRVRGVILGGADSLIRGPVAQRLDEAGRLKSASSPLGFTPGEGAAFVLLESAASAHARGCTAYATVKACAIGEELSAGNGEPNIAAGLATALRGAREQAGLETMPFMVCDLNGERERAHEFMLAATRALGDLHGEEDVWHPADRIGDPGAAAAVIDLVWAAMALHRGYAPQPRALVWGASDGALRGAAVLDPA